MYESNSVKLQNLLLSLSDALDLADPLINQHQIRTAFIAWQISRVMDLPQTFENDLFIASLLHDVGALSPEEKLSIHDMEVANPDQHCILGERLLKSVPIFSAASWMVRYHHTPWEQFEVLVPTGSILGAQIISLADHVERSISRSQFILHQNEAIIEHIRSLSGNVIAPELLDVFLSLSYREDFWLDLVSPRLYSVLLNNGPCQSIDVEPSRLLAISEMFRAMIDFRSRFTATHSSGVATAAATLSRLFGFTETEVEMMEVAGNLHDLGKLVIPNHILTKPDKLTREEYALMRQHTYHTYMVLKTIGGIQQVAEWAAFHHEHLDGSGYPFHLTARDLSIQSRIMGVADVFTALSENRPYRASMDRESILRTLTRMSQRNWLDASVVALLEKNYAMVTEATRSRQDEVQNEYELNFLVAEAGSGSTF